jgi:tetratricopeptide (TPR) repeat protein
MLFDLRSGKRRRVVQIVFGALAATFLIGFLGFGVGVGNGPGGIFDALGIGGNSSNPNSQAFSQEIDNAEARVKKNPQDENALLNLAKYETLSANAQLGAADQTTGLPVVTDEARAEYVKAVAAWERYLKVADKPDATTAGQIAAAYEALGDHAAAARAQQIFADARPSATTYYQLAYYSYESLDLKAGDAAAKQAVGASRGAQKKQTQKLVDQLSKAARQFKKAQSAGTQTTPGGGLDNPLGGLGGSTTPTP